MQLIDQHTKKIMEECKERARDAGLQFDDETLEYIVTNRDMLDLSPKNMIPTLYDYWVHDVETLKEYGKYKLFPSNPYETVINTRPAISFYNDNNPDWMNIMIFYHVIGHIDFFQNNALFEHTWSDDFAGQALADKRLIAQLRAEKGRWVDYAIEFSRSIDNIVGYFDGIAKLNYDGSQEPSRKLHYYFNVFLREIVKLPDHKLNSEIGRYNEIAEQNPEELVEKIFFTDVKSKYPEFQSKYEKYDGDKPKAADIAEYIRENSPKLQREENEWIKSVTTIVRNTGLYFAPQIRTKIINEGWASYWHDRLFRTDERIKGHEAGYAKLNAGVTSINRAGLNPYAIGLRLIEYVEDLAEKGKISRDFQKIKSIEGREKYDKKTGKGKEAIFKLRSNFSDFSLITAFCDQDFVDEHDLFVLGKRFNPERQTIQYYIKSRKGEDYKKMLLDSLYHPPVIEPVEDKTNEDNLYLRHKFEGKQLVKDFVPGVLIGLEFLWGGSVQLETTQIIVRRPASPGAKPTYELQPVLYTVKDKRISVKRL